VTYNLLEDIRIKLGDEALVLWDTIQLNIEVDVAEFRLMPSHGRRVHEYFDVEWRAKGYLVVAEVWNVGSVIVAAWHNKQWTARRMSLEPEPYKDFLTRCGL